MAEFFNQQDETGIVIVKEPEHLFHIPVLKKEVESFLQLREGMTIVDCTVGLGGHAEGILKIIGRNGNLIGIDRDIEAVKKAQERLSCISDRFKLFSSNYADVDSVLKKTDISTIDGALFDLGVSSFQMDEAGRGFSIKVDGPLDMRMERRGAITAADIVNRYSRLELASLFKKYGDEYHADRIAERIIQERKKRRIENTWRLAEIVKEASPYRYRFMRIHPATKVFMALRIVVNDEIGSLEIGLIKIVPFLRSGARLCVISFHSIEDRVVKEKFREFDTSGKMGIITKKPIKPSVEEVQVNPRSRSAKLRVAEKR